MPMPSDVTGRLVMTKDSGEQSSFSTPFIDEFNHISNRYYQYFELVLLGKETHDDPNSWIFHVYLKNKDYTEMDNSFEKGLDLKFNFYSERIEDFLTCTYKNYERSYTDTGIVSMGEGAPLDWGFTSYTTIFSFLIYPETCDDETFVDEHNVFDDVYYHELLVFYNGTIIAKNIKIPDTLVNNFSVGFTIEKDTSNNFSYQWNFSNDRFIYMDLAYQCYEEITTKSMSDYRYSPLYRLNTAVFSNDRYDLLMLPYVNFSNDGINRFKIEIIYQFIENQLETLFSSELNDPNISNIDLVSILLSSIKNNHLYFYNKYTQSSISDEISDNNSGIIINISYRKSNGKINIHITNIEDSKNLWHAELNDNSNKEIISFRYLNDGSNTTTIGDIEEYTEGDEYIQSLSSYSTEEGNNLIPGLNNIIIQTSKCISLDSINLGTKPFKVYFTRLEETKGTNYVSPYNTYWKSLFYTSRTYPFTNPLKNNPIFIPYVFNDYENNNMYMEVTFGTNASVTYYCYIGSGFSITTNDDPDTKTVNMLNGYVIVYKGNGTYTLYRYNNGVQSTIIGNMDVGTDSTTFYFKSLIDPKEESIYSEIGYGDIASTIPSSDQSKFYAVCIHAIADNNTSDMGSITINFGPDGYVYQDKVDDLWEYDEFDKLFTTDIDSNFDYAQGNTSDFDDQSDYTIDGQLNTNNIQVDEDDPNYIIDGTLEYIPQFEIIDVSISPNRFETDLSGQPIDMNMTIVVTLDRTNTFFGGAFDSYLGRFRIEYTNNGELLTPINGTLVYVSHTDTTMTFTCSTVQPMTSSYGPGDYKINVTIKAEDAYNQTDEYTVEDAITITIKPTSYHKENKAKLHQFLSASGGGGLEEPV